MNNTINIDGSSYSRYVCETCIWCLLSSLKQIQYNVRNRAQGRSLVTKCTPICSIGTLVSGQLRLIRHDMHNIYVLFSADHQYTAEIYCNIYIIYKRNNMICLQSVWTQCHNATFCLLLVCIICYIYFCRQVQFSNIYHVFT